MRADCWSTKEKYDSFFPVSIRYSGSGFLDGLARWPVEHQLLNDKAWDHFISAYETQPDTDLGSWKGEFWGKFMRGACMTYAWTHDEKLYDRIRRAVEGLLTAQQPDGSFTSFAPQVRFNGWDVWSRKYVMLGLEHFLAICPGGALTDKVTAALCRHADAIMAHVGSGRDRIPITKTSNYWLGMNSCSLLEPVVLLYNLTGRKKYLDFARYIVESGFADGANLISLALEDRLCPYQYPVTKAYEMMSCFEGLVEYGRATGDEQCFVAVRNFVKRVIGSDRTIIGCCGCTHELFDHSTVRQATFYEGIMQETCVTVTWMKLLYQLLRLDGDALYADEMEKAIFNALAGSLNTDSMRGGALPFDSYAPLLFGPRGRVTGGRQQFPDKYVYGCCASIASAGTSLAALCSVQKIRGGYALTQYQSGRVVAEDLDITVKTGYPADGNILITWNGATKDATVLRLRIPGWADHPSVAVNGETVTAKSGSWVDIERPWQPGDTVEIRLETHVLLFNAPDNPDDPQAKSHVAFVKGPLVLCRDKRFDPHAGEPVRLSAPDGTRMETIPCEESGFPHLCAVTLQDEDGKRIRLCDFSSGGKTWDDRSGMEVWIEKV